MQFSIEQQRVIDEFDMKTNILIPSSPGAGKSTLILELSRLAVEKHNLDPSQIMMITFTSSAGLRMEHSLPYQYAFCNTFHSIGTIVLHKYRLLNLEDELYSPDNVLIQFVNFLRSNTEAAIQFKRSLKLVFIDELQDNNTLMMAIAKSLSEVKAELMLSGCCVVGTGDDDQNLMSFQGSDIKWIENFPQIFNPCKVFYLSVNFRCSTPIVELANEILAGRNQTERVLNDKPRGKSLEQYLWDLKGTPQNERISSAPKPRLCSVSTSQQAIECACEDIKHALERNMWPPHELCIITRNNDLLNYAKTVLSKMNIPSIMLKHATKQSKIASRKRKREQMDTNANSDADDDESTAVRGYVILTTPFTAKGLEFDKGYICLEHGVWPDRREADLEKERRVLFTAVTRFKCELTVYNVLPKTSIFLIELQKRGLIEKLFQANIKILPDNIARIESSNRYKIVNECEETKEEMENKDHVQYMKAWIKHRKEAELCRLAEQWVSNLNGCSLLKLKDEIFPVDFSIKVSPVPILYQIPVPGSEQKYDSIDDEKKECEEEEETEEEEVDDEESEEDEKEAESNSPFLFPEEPDFGEDEDYDDADYILPHAHSKTVLKMCLEEEIVLFLDCWMIRWLQEMQLKFSSATLPAYCYIPAQNNYSIQLKKQIELEKNQSDLIKFHYARYKNTENSWENILFSIYWTSTCAGLYNKNLSVFYNRIKYPVLTEYKFMLDEMAKTLHFLIYASKASPDDNGHNFPEWKFCTFEDATSSKKPSPYIQVGSKLILWSNDQSDFGAFPQDIVLKSLAYASLKNISESETDTRIKIIQIYHTFTRKICTISLDNTQWDLQRQATYVRYIKNAKRSVFDGYEEL